MRVSCRVVLDANVIVSALISPTGAPGRLLCLCMRSDRIALVVNETILQEYSRALAYKKVVRYTKLGAAGIERLVAAIALVAEIVDGPLPPRPGCEDESDDVYLQVAEVASASCVVTGDQHLLSMKQWNNIAILTPRAMLDRLES